MLTQEKNSSVHPSLLFPTKLLNVSKCTVHVCMDARMWARITYIVKKNTLLLHLLRITNSYVNTRTNL